MIYRKKCRNAFIVVYALYFVSSPVLAYQPPIQQETFLITKYDTQNGLPATTVSDITFGDDGYLYLASVNGLVRMDGFHIDLISSGTDSGLMSNRISKIFNMDRYTLVIKDDNNFVYAFTDGTVRQLLNPGTTRPIQTRIIRPLENGTLFLLDDENAYLMRNSQPEVIAPSLSSHTLWDGIYLDGIVYLLNTDDFYIRDQQGYTRKPIPENRKPDLSFFSRIEVLEDGHLRIIGRQHSACYDPGDASWCSLHSFSLENENEEIHHIKSLDDERFLIATSGGFYIQQGAELKPVYESRNALVHESIFFTSYGEILVAADGVWINGEKVFTPSSRIIDAEIDNNEQLWFSAAQEGVFAIRKNPFIHYSSDILVNSYSIVKDREGNFWAGSFENGLVMWNENQSLLFNHQNSILPANTIRMLAPLRDGGVLIGGWGAPPFVYKNDEMSQLTGFWPLFGIRTNATEAFYEDMNGTWWLGTITGLVRKIGENYTTFYDNTGKTLRNINRIVRSPYNTDLFFSTSTDGIVLLRNNRFHFLSENLDAASAHVRDVLPVSADTIWVAAYNIGLQRFIIGDDPEEAVVSELNASNGFFNAGYHRIIPDQNGYFWISTNSGLLKVSQEGLNKSMDQNRVMTNFYWFTEKDGLLDNEFNGGTQSTGFYESDTGLIWFTSMAGVVSFNPELFQQGEISPEKFEMQNLRTPLNTYRFTAQNSVRLAKDEREVTIQYAHKSLVNNITEQIWINRGGNQEWVKAETPGLITLNDLDTGLNEVSFSSEPGGPLLASLHIHVTPYFYESSIFRFGVPMILAGFVFVFYRRMKNRGQRNRSDQEKSIPGEDEAVSLYDDYSASKERIKDFIDHNFTDPNLNVDLISNKLSMSRSTLYRNWNTHYEKSIADYICTVRLEHAKKLILNQDCKITEAAYHSGFNSQSYFTKVFKKKYGKAPSQLLNGSNKNK